MPKKHETLKGWKCFKTDLTCRDFQFEVGKSYEVQGKVRLCENGFHFHSNPKDLFNYYPDNRDQTVVCEVVAHDVLEDGDKCAARKIEVVRQLSFIEVVALRQGYGDGNGDGDGYGNGNGNGYGDGYGNGYGNGYGYGDGYGNGYGNGYGDGYGYGNGYGDGDGYGYGSYTFPDFITFLEDKAA